MPAPSQVHRLRVPSLYPVPLILHRCAAPQDAIPELDGTHEVYPGTLTMLPGDRILCTWDCEPSGGVHLYLTAALS